MTKDATLTDFERLLTPNETATSLSALAFPGWPRRGFGVTGPSTSKSDERCVTGSSGIRDYLRARTRTSTSEK